MLSLFPFFTVWVYVYYVCVCVLITIEDKKNTNLRENGGYLGGAGRRKRKVKDIL